MLPFFFYLLEAAAICKIVTVQGASELNPDARSQCIYTERISALQE